MIRLIFVISALAFGYWRSGWWGAFSMLIITAIVLSPFAYGGQEKQVKTRTVAGLQTAEDFTDEEENETWGARRGKRIDPTRPTPEDYAAMITNNYGKRV